jgi:hypothetical protein
MKKMIKSYCLIALLSAITFSLITGCSEKDTNSPPVADFNISPNEGSILTIFEFDASGCSDEEDITSTLQVRWDWEGDGIFDTDYSTNKILYHQYFQTGMYDVILEVKDSEEISTSIKKSVEVGLGPIPTVTTASVTDTTAHTVNCGGEVTNIGGTDVIARGVCWSTEPNPTILNDTTMDGSGIGPYTSHIAGLIPSTVYYLRAYATNMAGTAYGNELTFTTLYAWSCGNEITIDHEAGNVAPVNKTVTYTTVGDIPGESSKCWIIKNLGADNAATSVNDVSETAAGWYWQFNHKQGYKHDGATRTPNTAWIDPLNEDSDWLAGNDPCALELEGGWRIPTATEWNNINNSNQWNNWNDAWNSGLKLHASGTLKYLDGSVDRRGIIGYFWSSTQFSNSDGKSLGFGNDFSQIWGNAKSHGFNIRCILDI